MLRTRMGRGARRRVWATLCALGCAFLFSRLEPVFAQSGRQPRSSARATEFRQNAKAEMETALGAELKVKQDAINAAYLSAGWKWGEEQRQEWDDAAFRRAVRWGFRIEEFARARQEPFALESLAEAPIRPGDATANAPYAPLTRKPALTLQPSLISAAPDAEPSQVKANAKDEVRIREVEARLASAQRDLSEIERRLSDLERDRRSAHAERPSAEMQVQIESLKRMLEASSRKVTSAEAELQALTRDISVN